MIRNMYEWYALNIKVIQFYQLASYTVICATNHSLITQFNYQ